MRGKGRAQRREESNNKRNEHERSFGVIVEEGEIKQGFSFERQDDDDSGDRASIERVTGIAMAAEGSSDNADMELRQRTQPQQQRQEAQDQVGCGYESKTHGQRF